MGNLFLTDLFALFFRRDSREFISIHILIGPLHQLILIGVTVIVGHHPDAEEDRKILIPGSPPKQTALNATLKPQSHFDLFFPVMI